MKKLKYLIAALLLAACLIGSASAVTPMKPCVRENRCVFLPLRSI